MRKQRHMLLVEHLAGVWPKGETFVPTAQILDALKREHADEWGEFARFGRPLTSQAMGRMIAGKFGVHTCRPDTNGPRGYLWADLDPVLRRLGMGTPDEPDEPAEPDEVADQQVCAQCTAPIYRAGATVCARCSPTGPERWSR